MNVDLSENINSQGLVSKDHINKLLLNGYSEYIDNKFIELRNELLIHIDRKISEMSKTDFNSKDYIDKKFENYLDQREQILKLKEEIFNLKTTSQNITERHKNIYLRTGVPFSFYPAK